MPVGSFSRHHASRRRQRIALNALRASLLSSSVLLLAACGPTKSPMGREYAEPDHDVIAAIHAAGEQSESALTVTPLANPGVEALQQAARVDAEAGRLEAARSKLDQALVLSPKAPDLLQAKAEVAIRAGHYDRAETLAYNSWQNGPQLGPLCARNWQTIAEVRALAGDTAGAATARRWVAQCAVEVVPRY